MILTDFFGPEDGVLDGDGTLMDFGGRFRMGSAMMANTERRILMNPELTYQIGPLRGHHPDGHLEHQRRGRRPHHLPLLRSKWQTS